MRAQGLFIFLPDRVDGACHKSAEVRSWGGGKMNVQDGKANKNPFLHRTMDHLAIRSQVQADSYFNHIDSLKNNVFIYFTYQHLPV